MTTPPLDSTRQKRSEMKESITAREDPSYHVCPQHDGLYHCQFNDCGHPPDKLKCNHE